MEDFLEESMSYAGFIESSAQDKCARTLISCYIFPIGSRK